MNNNTNHLVTNTSTQSPLESPNIFWKVIVTAIPTFTFIVNLPAIALLIWMILRKKTAKNIHLVSIGITDALVGLTAYLSVEPFIYTDSHFSFYDCYFRFYFFGLTFVASMLHVLGICVQRLKVVVSGAKTQNQRLFEWAIIVVSWVISVIVNTISFVVWTRSKTDLAECSIDSLVSGKEKYFFNFLGWTTVAIELLVVVVMGMLLQQIWVRKRKLPGNQIGAKDLRLCVTVSIMAVVFLAGTSPFTIVLLSYDFLGETRRQKRVICSLIALLNSSINPFVYLLRSVGLKCVCKKTNVVANIDIDTSPNEGQRKKSCVLPGTRRKDENITI